MVESEDSETVEVVLKVRKCDNRDCRRDAIVLEGPGTPCPTCTSGELLYTTGDVKTVEFRREAVEQIADSEIQEIKD